MSPAKSVRRADRETLVRRTLVVPVAGIAVTTAYGLLLVLTTKVIIAEPFRYLGYDQRPGPGWAMVTWWIVTLCLLALLDYRRWERPSQMAFTFLVATIGVPVLSIPVFWGPLSNPRVVALGILTLTCFATMRLVLAGGRKPWHALELPPMLYWGVVLLWCAVVIAYLLITVGLAPGLLSLSDVYEQREAFSSRVTGIGSYLVGWLSAGTLPLVVAYGLRARRTALTAFAALSIVAMYSLTGNKSYLVGVILTTAAFVLAGDRFRRGWHWLAALGTVVLVAALTDLANQGFGLSSLLVRRALATSGLNTALFFDFFQFHPRYHLGHSVLSPFFSPPYPLSPASIIGLEYYGNADVSANANLIADGYANFGLLGSLGMFVVFGLYLRVVDKAAAHLPLQVSGPALTLVMIAAANTAALTVLMTHGGLVLFALLLAMPALPVRATSPPEGAGSTRRASLGRRRRAQAARASNRGAAAALRTSQKSTP
jgi:oligosaccharide repeat unit polymerase